MAYRFKRALFAAVAACATVNAGFGADTILPSARRTPAGAIYFPGSPTPFVLDLPQTCPANQWAMGSSPTTGLPICVQPSFSNIKDTVALTQLPTSGVTAGSYGGTNKTLSAVVDQYGRVTGLSASSIAITLSQVTDAGTAAGANLGTSGATVGRNSDSKTDSGNNVDTGSRDMSGATSVKVPTVATGTTGTAAASAGLVDAKIAVGNFASLATNTYTGKQTFPASTASAASMSLPPGTAPTSPVNGDVWTTSAGVYARVNGGTVGPFVSSTSPGSRMLLNTLTASNSATLQDTTSITSTYSEYEVQLENIVCATNGGTLTANVRQAGAWTTSGYSSYLAYFANTSSSVNNVTPTAFIQLSISIANSGFAGYNGKMTLSVPANTGRNNVIVQGFSVNSSFLYSVQGGSVTPAGAITGFQWQCDSGNIASGTIKVYGYN